MTHGVLGVLVVHLGIVLFWLIIKAISRPIYRRGFLGFYMVLMPMGFQVWDNWQDVDRWVVLALALTGLLVVTRTFGPAIKEDV